MTAPLPSMRCVCGHWDTEHAAFTRNVRPGKTRTFCDHCDCRSWTDSTGARAARLKDAAPYINPRSRIGREALAELDDAEDIADSDGRLAPVGLR